MRKSVMIDDGLNKKIMNLTAKMIRDTSQEWSTSAIINSLLVLAFRNEITTDKIIKVQDELGKHQETG